MSFRKGFRLPPSKLISRSGGKRKVEYVYRGIPNSKSFTRVEDTTSTSSSVVSSTNSTTSVIESTMSEASSSYNPSMNELSCYEIESRASLAGWESIRKGLIAVVVECAAMPPVQSCVACEADALLRCQKCGPCGFYCCSCFEKVHCIANFMHTAEKWEVCNEIWY